MRCVCSWSLTERSPSKKTPGRSDQLSLRRAQHEPILHDLFVLHFLMYKMRQAKLLRLTAIILSEDEDYCQRNNCSITFLKLAYPSLMSTGQFQLCRYSLKFHFEFCFDRYSTDHYSVRTSSSESYEKDVCLCMHIFPFLQML